MVVILDQSSTYLVFRAILWVSLAGAQAVHLFLSRAVSTTPRALTVNLALCSVLFSVRDVLFAVHFWLVSRARGNLAFFTAVVGIDDAAEAYFLGILLLISAGYCITTTRLSEMKRKNIALPIAYLISTLTFAYLTIYDSSQAATLVERPSYAAFYFLLMLVQAGLLVFMWLSIFEGSEQVYRALEVQQAARRGGVVSDVPDAGSDGYQSPRRPEDDGPREGIPPGGAYATLDDEVTTVAEAVDLDVKFRLMRQFRVGVCAFMVASLIALVMPVWAEDEYGRTTLAAYNLMTVSINAVRLALMVFLAWVFRLTSDSPYLLIDDATDAVPLDTALDSAEGDPHTAVDVQMKTFQSEGQVVKSPMARVVTAASLNGADGSPRERSPRRSPRHAAPASKAHTVSAALRPPADAPPVDPWFSIDDDK